MQINPISFKGDLLKDFQQNNVAVFSPMLTLSPADKTEISSRTDQKRSSFEKFSLEILATATLIGIGMFAFRKNIAKALFKEPSRPTIQFRDDTEEQAISYIANREDLILRKSFDELLQFTKLVKDADLAAVGQALLGKANSRDNKTVINVFEPIVERYFKNDKVDWRVANQIKTLANFYESEKQNDKVIDLLSKANKKWINEDYDMFKSKLVSYCSKNGFHQDAINIWKDANSKKAVVLSVEKKELIPVYKSYVALNDLDNAIEIFKRYGNFYDKELSDSYVNIMLKQNKQNELMKEILETTSIAPESILELLHRNLSKLKISEENKQIINIMAQGLKAENDLPCFGFKPFNSQAYENIKILNEVTKFLKGKALPEDYADEMIKVLREILDARIPEEASEKAKELYKYKFSSVSGEYPAYQWLKTNLLN